MSVIHIFKKSSQYLMQSRSQHRHQEAVVNVAQQLGFNGGMSNLKMTVSYLFITYVEERLSSVPG